MEKLKRAAAALIFNRDKHILGVSRKNNHNDFGLPSGKVEENETFEECAIREAKEETGLDVYIIEKVFSKESNGFLVETFLCEPILGLYPDEFITEEKGLVKWIQWEDLFNGSFGEYNSNLYKNLINNIKF